MEIIGRHNNLNHSEDKVLNWLEEGLHKIDGKILVEPGYRKFKYQDWPDFVLITKSHGIIIIECKGLHQEEIQSVSNTDLITRTGTDRYGKQLASYGCIFKRLLKDKNIPVSKFAIFPNILATHSVAEAILQFNTDPNDVRILFNEALDWPCSLDYMGVKPLPKKLSSSEYNEILSLVNPTRVISYDPTLDLEGLEQSIRVLDEKQTDYVEKMEKGHHLVNGLPGTGKTVLLMQIAKREIDLGKNVLYTCYNVPLNEQFQKIFGPEIAKTSQSLFFQLAVEYGASKEILLTGFDKSIAYLMTQEIRPKFDTILVDEYQDLDDNEIQVLVKMLYPDGLLVLGGDRLQSIRSSRDSWKSLGVHIKGHSYFLDRPYRTHPDVVDYALAFAATNKSLQKEVKTYFDDYKFLHRKGKFENFQKRIFFLLKNENEFVQEVKKIHDQNPTSKILIITPTAEHLSKIADINSSRIRILSFQRVKGLEADIVIFFGIDQYLRADNVGFAMTNLQKMRSVFSGLCRARGGVFIHGFEPRDFYQDLHEVFQACVKKKLFSW